jgi:peptide/nickel transport system ATP-binding protein
VRLAEVGISDPSVADKYPFQLSGGMRQRVAIAAAIAEKPRILVADEPTTALDVSTQKDVLELLDRLRREHDMGLLLITHDLRVAFSTCDRVYVMYAGQVVEEATGEQLRAAPHHPYSAALMAADPPLERRLDRLVAIPGRVPPPGGRPDGCRFAPRCEFAQDVCGSAPVDLAPAGDGRRSRCVRPEVVPLLRGPVLADAPSPPPAARGDVGEAVVTLREVRKSYGSTTAVRSADLDVLPGESVGIVGESGSGKTTLARMIVGLVRPTSGHVRVGGVEVGRSTTRRDLDRVRGTVQMAFQDPHSTLNPSRTVGAALRDGLRLAGERDVRGRVAGLLEMVGLPAEYAARRPAQLSGGERQRVAIARALSRGPQVLVCDEVVSALDVSVQANVLNLLRDLQAELGLALVFITHDLAVVRQVTDRVYVLCAGEVVESGATARVLDAPEHPYTQRLISSIPDATARTGSAVT